MHLSQAIARVLGVRAEVHTAEFDSIIVGVNTTYDAGISSFTVTRERTAAMNMIAYINMTGSLWAGMADHFFNNTVINIVHVVSSKGTH